MNKVRLTNWLMLFIWVTAMILGGITMYYILEQDNLEKENKNLKQQIETLKINNQDCIIDFRQELERANTLR